MKSFCGRSQVPTIRHAELFVQARQNVFFEVFQKIIHLVLMSVSMRARSRNGDEGQT